MQVYTFNPKFRRHMKTAIYYLSIVLILYGLITCQKEKAASRPYPRITTLDVANIGASGATFNAEIISGNINDIIEYGFIWDQQENLQIDVDDKCIIQGHMSEKKFSAEVHSALAKGKLYYVAAFVRTSDYLVYGNPVSFTSLGCEAPIIKDFNPKTGSWGDTIKISGKNFSYKNSSIEVKLGNVSTVFVSSTDTTIKVVIPAQKNSEKVNLKVSIEGNSSESASQFTYLLPQIINVTPLAGSFNDTVSINGINFFKDANSNNVYFDGIRANFVSASRTLLKVIVPPTLTSLQSKIRITGPINDIEYGTSFTIKNIQLTSFEPDTAFVPDQIITIKGENFNPLSANNKVTIKGVEAPIVESSSTQIKVRIPASIIPANNLSFFSNGEITVTSSTRSAKFDKKLEIYLKRRWTKMKDFPGNNRIAGIGFSIQDKGYIGLGYSGNAAGPYYKDFWEFNPNRDEWTQKADFPGTERMRESVFTLGNEGYAGLGSANVNLMIESYFKDFYKYNPTTNAWTRIMDYPGKARASAAAFVKDEIAFVGTGRSKDDGTSTDNTINDDFWSFNPSSGQWNTALKFTSKIQFALGLTIGNSGYIYDYGQIREYGETTWINKAYRTIGNFPEIVTFTIGTSAYLMSSDFSSPLLEYNKTTNQISTITIPEQIQCALPSVFTINNKAYIVCGKQSSATKNVWEFDPGKP